MNMNNSILTRLSNTMLFNTIMINITNTKFWNIIGMISKKKLKTIYLGELFWHFFRHLQIWNTSLNGYSITNCHLCDQYFMLDKQLHGWLYLLTKSNLIWDKLKVLICNNIEVMIKYITVIRNMSFEQYFIL